MYVLVDHSLRNNGSSTGIVSAFNGISVGEVGIIEQSVIVKIIEDVACYLSHFSVSIVGFKINYILTRFCRKLFILVFIKDIIAVVYINLITFKYIVCSAYKMECRINHIPVMLIVAAESVLV